MAKKGLVVLSAVAAVAAMVILQIFALDRPPPKPQDALRAAPPLAADGPAGGLATQEESTDEPHDQTLPRNAPNIGARTPSQVPPKVVEGEEPDVSPEQVRWTDNIYLHPEAPIKAERYRFLQINWNVLYDALEKTPAYLAAVSGRTPPPVYDDTPPTFRFMAFENRPLDLLVTEVEIDGEPPGSRNIVMRGEVAGIDKSTFRLSMTEGEVNLTGRIETPEYMIRVDTFNRGNRTTVAEFDQAAIDRENIPVDRLD